MIFFIYIIKLILLDIYHKKEIKISHKNTIAKIIENNINDIEVDDFERKDISTNDLLNKKEKLNRIKKIITELKNLS